MSEPRDDRGGDAFDDFFGDPSPSGRMGPVDDEAGDPPFAIDPEDEPTQSVELRGRTEEPTQAVAPAPVIRPEPTPHGAVPESWWEPEQEPHPATTPQSSTWQATPAPVTHPSPGTDRPAPRQGISPLALVALFVGAVLLGGACVGGTVMAMSGDDEPVAQSTTVTETTTPQEPSSSSTTPSSSSSSTPSSSSSKPPKRTGKKPAGVKECSGPRKGVAAGSGSEVTSCAFAVAVRDAYVGEKPSKGATTLEVRSPVTHKNYRMTCRGQVVTRCTGGNDAVVVLY